MSAKAPLLGLHAVAHDAGLHGAGEDLERGSGILTDFSGHNAWSALVRKESDRRNGELKWGDGGDVRPHALRERGYDLQIDVAQESQREMEILAPNPTHRRSPGLAAE